MGSIFNFSGSSNLNLGSSSPVVEILNQDNSASSNFGQLTNSTILKTNPILIVNQTTPNQPVSKDGPLTGGVASNLQRQATSAFNNITQGVLGTGFNINVQGQYAGIANEAGTAGQTKQVALHGQFVEGMPSGTIGSRRYINTSNGTLQTTDNGYYAGRYIDATTLQVITS